MSFRPPLLKRLTRLNLVRFGRGVARERVAERAADPGEIGAVEDIEDFQPQLAIATCAWTRRLATTASTWK
jgi:hypothetical protein